MSTKEDFKSWLLRNNKPGSGKAKSYLTGIEEAQLIAQSGANFLIPSIYCMPDDSLARARFSSATALDLSWFGMLVKRASAARFVPAGG